MFMATTLQLGERMRTTYRSVDQGNQRPSSNIRSSLAGRPVAPPTNWWRMRSPYDIGKKDVRAIRTALLRTDLVGDADWFLAVRGDAAQAIGIAIKALKINGMRNPLTDVVMSAVLCCAVKGDPAAKVVMLSALRRRAKIDPTCHGLHLRWLNVRF
jgi:hypothetical protein